METRLYTNPEGVLPSERIPVVDRDTAIAEAKRCIQCHCDECIKGCAFLQHYNKFPRILTREIYNRENVPKVRGIHFQPVSWFGRHPGMPEGDGRYTLDELMADISDQAGIPMESFLPSRS